MSVDYGIYATKGKRMLLAIRAMVNGRKAVAYVIWQPSAALDPASSLRTRMRRSGCELAHLAHRNRVSQSKTKLLPVWCCSNA